MRDHASDAGGDPRVLEDKARLRDEVWAELRAAGAARFPGAEGRIPNFKGAEQAAERLRTQPCWQDAEALKANPDSPQWPVRQRALEDGIIVYMAAPRLAAREPFLLLDPAVLEVSPRQAASIKGAGNHARPVGIGALRTVDLVVVGSVAVDRRGARLGKGGGFADLEFALAEEAGLIGEHTLVATTVHPVQVVEPDRIPMTAHDVPLDLIITPNEVIGCVGSYERHGGVRWGELTDEKIAAIPVLEALRP